MSFAAPVYTGQVAMDLAEAVRKVSDYLAAHEDVFAGGHFTHESSHFSVSVAKPDDPAVNGLHDLIAALGPVRSLFSFEVVERSTIELDKIQMAIVNEFAIESPAGRMRKGSRIQSVGKRDSPSRVTVELLRDPDGLPLAENPEARAVNARFPGAVMFREVDWRIVPTS
ncbi:hypothetical protein ACT3TS_05690 [Specibacter sp. AOP5-B1-6]|uniref:hypothetical protein n=1 Tax=Specibacter sp. AOP5-B1-6 TaxID=3457653 RepID=UPI00402BE5F2